MDENKTNVTDTSEVELHFPKIDRIKEVDVPEETQTENPTDEMISISQAEYDKRVQSETDKVRTSYTKKIKELEAKVKELSPVEKSESETELENRIAELDKKQAELDAREAALKLNDALNAKGIGNELSAFLRSDVDVDALANVIDTMVANRVKATGYVPSGHKSAETLTKEDFRKMSYEKKKQLFDENPELYRTLAGR